MNKLTWPLCTGLSGTTAGMSSGMLISALAAELTGNLETWTQRSTKCGQSQSRVAECGTKIKAHHATIGTNNAAQTATRVIVRQESKNGGEQEAAIPLTGGFVRSVMVRVQFFFTAFRRRGRHLFGSWGNSLEPDDKLADFRVVSPWTGDR